MAHYRFLLPDIGEGIAEAEIVAWHVDIGSYLAEDDNLVDVMTDKATVAIESPVYGRVVELGGAVGDSVLIGSVLVIIETEETGIAPGVPADTGSSNETARTNQEVAEAETTSPADLIGQEEQDQRPNLWQENLALEPRQASSPRILAAPAVRARASDLGIDLAQVRPTVDGRIRHADLDAFVAYNGTGGFQAAGMKRPDETVKVIGLRRRIAENMAASKRHIPHFTYVERYDVTVLEEFRAQLNVARGERPKLTMLPFLITAICRLVPRYPMLNAHFDDEKGEVTRFGTVHVGIAAQTPGGLMVPVIRDAQDRNLWQLAGEIGRLATAAREGTARSGELSGSTITLTSLGPMGGIATAPVINRPEVAIIGPNAIIEQPIFTRDATGAEKVEKRKIMNISMSCDHRVVDGWDAASFAQDLKTLLEAPAVLLAEKSA